jgi:tetratricopeptide (TPR) repeat protein
MKAITTGYAVPILLLLVLITPVSQAEESDAGDDSKCTEIECHKKFAIESNNEVWGLLTKESRTAQEDENMIHAAHASHYHWSKIGKPINIQRGHWLISHVYAVLNKPDQALDHAKKCLSLTEEHVFVDFDMAYAYEAMARANAAAGNESEAAKYLKMARDAAEKIKAEEDRQLFNSDLKAGPWYGVE